MKARIGSYRIVRELGRGGMGAVYEAVHDVSGVRRALKVFTLDHGNREFLERRFLAEGRLLAKLDHPRLVRVVESALDADTQAPYFAMDLVLNAGGISQTLEQVRKAGAVTEEQALGWLADICEGLDYVHAAGVVHRDIKLENILIGADNRAVISDFGVSRIVADRLRDELMVTTTFVTGETTGTKPVMGTFWYLAPELRQGGEATPASDWYAVGVLMYRLLTGMWYEPGTAAFELLSPFSPECQAVVRRLLSDDPAQRRPEALGLRRWRHWRRRRVVKFAAVALAGLAVAAAGVIGWRLSRAPSPVRLALTPEVALTLRPCPAGTNAIGEVAVAITRPYWLGETPVTWRQWLAAGGVGCVPWKGGEDAPVTYVTGAEIEALLARLNVRFAAEIPAGYELRLPTVAEWRLAFAAGGAQTDGWFGQGKNGSPETANLRGWYRARHLPVPLANEIWPDFPPRRIRPGKDEWMRLASAALPVPVREKPADGLGLYDLAGNCFERAWDRVKTNEVGVMRTECGFEIRNPYPGQGLAVTNPVSRYGDHVMMLGQPFAPKLAADGVWGSFLERLPHLGFRLCLGPKLEK